MLKATDIRWDTDGKKVDLPSEVLLPTTVTDADDVADWLSDTYGWCIFGCAVTIVE